MEGPVLGRNLPALAVPLQAHCIAAPDLPAAAQEQFGIALNKPAGIAAAPGAGPVHRAGQRLTQSRFSRRQCRTVQQLVWHTMLGTITLGSCYSQFEPPRG